MFSSVSWLWIWPESYLPSGLSIYLFMLASISPNWEYNSLAAYLSIVQPLITFDSSNTKLFGNHSAEWMVGRVLVRRSSELHLWDNDQGLRTLLLTNSPLGQPTIKCALVCFTTLIPTNTLSRWLICVILINVLDVSKCYQSCGLSNQHALHNLRCSDLLLIAMSLSWLWISNEYEKRLVSEYESDWLVSTRAIG